MLFHACKYETADGSNDLTIEIGKYKVLKIENTSYLHYQVMVESTGAPTTIHTQHPKNLLRFLGEEGTSKTLLRKVFEIEQQKKEIWLSRTDPEHYEGATIENLHPLSFRLFREEESRQWKIAAQRQLPDWLHEKALELHDLIEDSLLPAE